MKVEARYCDSCGVKIEQEELRDGDAVEMEESIFYCKECKAKQAPGAKTDAAKGDGKARTLPAHSQGAKRLTSSRRLIARRLASGRLARTKAKLPPALTGSGEDLRKDPLPPSGSERPEKVSPERKKKLEERAKIRAKLDHERKKPRTEKTPTEEAKKADEPLAAKAASEAPAAGAAEKPKKKKKKKAKKAEKAEKLAKSETPVVAASDAKAETAEVVSEKKAELAADEKPAQAASDEKAADASSEKKAEESKAEKTETTKPEEKKSEEVVASATAPTVAEKPIEKAEVSEKKAKKKKKTEGKSEDLDELEEIEEEDEAPAKAKKADKAGAPEKTEKLDKKKSGPDHKAKSAGDHKAKSGSHHKAKSAGEHKAVATEEPKSGGKLKTASRTRAGIGKRIGSKASVEAAQADPGALPKKPAMPFVPMVALGILAIALVGVGAYVFSAKKTDSPQVAKRDPDELLNDLRAYAQQQKDPDEIAARWEGVRDAIDDSKKGECDTEAQAVRARLEQLAKSSLDEMNGKIDRALSAKDFDAALKAISEYPAALRASTVWLRQGPPRQDELVRRRDAFATGQALLAEAKRVWNDKKDKDAVEGIFAAYSEEYKQTDEGKDIANDFARLISEATHAEIEASGALANEERLKNALLNYQKTCAKRAKIVSESEGEFKKELGNDRFEWQVASDMMTESSKDAIKVQDGKLTLKSSGEAAAFIGKNKRDWSHFVVEFKLKATKGTKAWFLGKLSAGPRGASPVCDDLPITKKAFRQAETRPHFFAGVDEDTEVTLQYRYIGKTWDVVVNGKEVFLLATGSSSPVGGFGFKCEGGTLEISDVRAKVLSRRTATGEEEE